MNFFSRAFASAALSDDRRRMVLLSSCCCHKTSKQSLARKGTLVSYQNDSVDPLQSYAINMEEEDDRDAVNYLHIEAQALP
jgi:hypothetical protein